MLTIALIALFCTAAIVSAAVLVDSSLRGLNSWRRLTAELECLEGPETVIPACRARAQPRAKAACANRGGGLPRSARPRRERLAAA